MTQRTEILEKPGHSTSRTDKPVSWWLGDARRDEWFPLPREDVDLRGMKTYRGEHVVWDVRENDEGIHVFLVQNPEATRDVEFAMRRIPVLVMAR